MRISDDYILKTIVDEYIVVPVGNAVDISCMISVNETGARIWNMIEDGKGIDDIADNFVENYGIDRAEALTDINEFLVDLSNNGILIND